MNEAEGGEGATKLEAGRRCAELAQDHRIRSPGLELAGDPLDARAASGPDVPEDDPHSRLARARELTLYAATSPAAPGPPWRTSTCSSLDRRAGSPASWPARLARPPRCTRSEEHTSELQSHSDLVCRL